MKYDIFESISQRKYGENASQVGRMEEVTDFLFRSCANNETESCSSSEYGGNLYSGIVISDLKPKNVLKDIDGDLYVIDAEIKVKSN